MKTLLKRRPKSDDNAERPSVSRSDAHQERLSVENSSLRSWRPGRRAGVILGLLVGLLAVGLIWLFYFSSVLVMKQVVVQGVRGVSPNRIVEVAGLSSGTPLARIDSGVIESRVRDIPAIAEVHVSVRWPRTLVIDIVERTKVAYVKTPTGFAMIDVNAGEFDSQKRKPTGLPLLTVTDPAARTAALRVLASLPPDVSSRVISATADSPQTVVLRLTGGVTVIWGGADQPDLKAQVLRALLAKTKHQWFDLRAPDAPTGSAASPVPAPSPSATPPEAPTPNASGAAAPAATPRPGRFATPRARPTGVAGPGAAAEPTPAVSALR